MDAGEIPTDEYVVLVGYPTIADFFQFHKKHALSGPIIDEGALAQEWRRGNQRLRELESIEAGWADNPELVSLPPRMEPMAEAALQDPVARRCYSLVPSRWCMVELDKLVVYQLSVNLSLVKAMKAQMPPHLTDEALMRLALGSGRETQGVELTQLSDNVFSFSGRTMDLRMLEIAPLDPGAIQGYVGAGHAAAVIGVFIGVAANFVQAIRVRNRLILANGTHRVFALRELGITHIPCLVREISSEEELLLVGPPKLKEQAQLYIRSARPPLLKDYFDPRLRKILQAPRLNRMVQVQVNTQVTQTRAV